MTPDQLKAALRADGWRLEGRGLGRNSGVPWYAWKRLQDAVDCTCNEKPPSLIVEPWESIDGAGKAWRSVEIEITGEVRDTWVNFKAYSINMEDAMAELPRATAVLLAAWNAAAGVP